MFSGIISDLARIFSLKPNDIKRNVDVILYSTVSFILNYENGYTSIIISKTHKPIFSLSILFIKANDFRIRKLLLKNKGSDMYLTV